MKKRRYSTEQNVAALKQAVDELSLDKAVLQDVLSKKFPTSALKQVVNYVTGVHGYCQAGPAD